MITAFTPLNSNLLVRFHTNTPMLRIYEVVEPDFDNVVSRGQLVMLNERIERTNVEVGNEMLILVPLSTVIGTVVVDH